MSEVRIVAELRTEFGKGGARRTRRAGKIPAVIYGHGADPRHVSLPAREFANAVRKGGSNVLLTLAIEGKDELVLPKSIVRHPIKPIFEHIDLLAVRRGEKVTIDVPLTIVGDVVPDGLLAQEYTTVSLIAEATSLPSEIEISIEGLAIGSQITAGDLILPAGSSLAGDADLLLVAIQGAPTAEELEGEVETVETVEEEAAAEGEDEAAAPAE